MNLEIAAKDIEVLNKIFPKGIVFFDLETTGLSPAHSEILEFGAVKIKNGQASFFNELVKPNFIIPSFITKLTGITNTMVKDARDISRVLKDFVIFIEDFALMAHNAPFDIGYLMSNCFNQDINIANRTVYCSCKLSRKCLKDSPNHKLTTITDFLKINTLLASHRALGDAYLVYKIASIILANEENQKKLPATIIGNSFTFKKKIHQLISTEIINNQQQISIRYQGGSIPGVLRPIKPISILPLMNGTIVLYALCLNSNRYKNFDISKITDINT